MEGGKEGREESDRKGGREGRANLCFSRADV